MIKDMGGLLFDHDCFLAGACGNKPPVSKNGRGLILATTDSWHESGVTESLRIGNCPAVNWSQTLVDNA